jgi:hypothetical protein
VIFGGANGLLAVGGPFTDVAADAFCPFVLEIFTLGHDGDERDDL